MNLSTARSARRAKEVGLRKVVGARRPQVMRQFFGESLVFTFLSLGLALLMIRLVLPAFRNFTAKPLPTKDLLDPAIILGILGVSIATGFLSGSYPALFLSSFQPVAVLKGGRMAGATGGVFRKVMVVLQFSLSVVLIIGTTVIYNQVGFIKHKSLGFDREHLLYIRLEGKLLDSIVPLKNELLQSAGVQSVTATSHSPAGIYNNGHDWDWEGRDPSVNPLVTYFGVDPDFLKTFKMELAEEVLSSGNGSLYDFRRHQRKFRRHHGNAQCDRSRGCRNQTGNFGSSASSGLPLHAGQPGDRARHHLLRPDLQGFQTYRYLFVRLNPALSRLPWPISEKTVKSFNPDFPSLPVLDDDCDQMYRGRTGNGRGHLHHPGHPDQRPGVVRTGGIYG
jgi:hypothetical protein